MTKESHGKKKTNHKCINQDVENSAISRKHCLLSNGGYMVING